MRSILLVNPASVTAEATFYPQTLTIPGRGRMGGYPPLGLATVAALTPADFSIAIWDEAIQGPVVTAPALEQYDLIALTAYSNHLKRANEIGKDLRNRGVLTAIGGPGVSAAPERCLEMFDVLFLGEAELTWPRFLAEWTAGQWRRIYRQLAKPDLSTSPAPRWDSCRMDAYLMGTVQATRGCPFDCEFCDVVQIFGHRPRHKPVENILREVANLQRLGVARIFFCDDNFIGEPRFAKELLRQLVAFSRSSGHRMSYLTQLSLNAARDDELLALLADANFQSLFMGIESSNRESLVEANKPQNYRTDVLADLKKMQSYGLTIWASLIVGFDHDGPDIFDQHFAFLQQACTPKVSLTCLRAPRGTRLWHRMAREQRLVAVNVNGHQGAVHSLCNILPKKMTRPELYTGYRQLLIRLFAWDNFCARVKGMIGRIERRPQIAGKRSRSIVDLYSFFVALGGIRDLRALAAIAGTLWYTLRTAPFMLEKVCRMIVSHAMEMHMILEPVCDITTHQIREESAPEFQIVLEPARPELPAETAKFFRTAMPEIHSRIHQHISDPSRTNDVLVSACAAFLASGQPPELARLRELSDRWVAAENDRQGSAALPRDNSVECERPEFIDAAWQAIQQEFRALQTSASTKPPNHPLREGAAATAASE